LGKILIIDDDLDICETFSDILATAGHNVEVLRSNAAAFRLLPRMKPDVVLLDMIMPGSSGSVTLSFIRRLSSLSHTKVIIVSGHPEMAIAALSTWGGDLFLAKPVTPRKLLDAVASYL